MHCVKVNRGLENNSSNRVQKEAAYVSKQRSLRNSIKVMYQSRVFSKSNLLKKAQ